MEYFCLLLLFVLPHTNRTILETFDSSVFQPIAILPFEATGYIPCGDANHNDRPEVYLHRGTFVYALEHQGSNRFDSTLLSIRFWLTWGLDDLDQDGCADLFAQETPAVIVTESYDSISLPAYVAWCDTIEFNAGFMYVASGSLDDDSSPDIALQEEVSSLIRIYENTGNNRYELKARLKPVYPVGHPMRFCLAPDIDRDGRTEVVIGTDNGKLAFFEAVGDDTFEITAVCTLASRLYDITAVVSTDDIDRDGKKEIIACASNNFVDAVFYLIEAVSNDSFEVMWITSSEPGRGWFNIAASGDFDGDGKLELVTSASVTRVWRCAGNDSFELVWTSDSFLSPLTVYDINNDGRDELICFTTRQTTTILEYLPVGLAERQLRQLGRVSISPSVVARGKTIGLDGLPDGTKVEVLDVSGRVIAEPERLWNTTAILPGAYFLRLTKGNQSITRKVLVVE